MRLFHYTAAHHLDGGPGHAGPGITRVGLLPAIHPYLDLAHGVVWLTDSEKWAQTWSTRPVPGLGCDRNEVRATVVIPKTARAHLLRWVPDGRRLVITDQTRDDLESFGDPEHWYLFSGRIPPSWLRGIEYRPALVPA